MILDRYSYPSSFLFSLGVLVVYVLHQWIEITSFRPFVEHAYQKKVERNMQNMKLLVNLEWLVIKYKKKISINGAVGKDIQKWRRFMKI